MRTLLPRRSLFLALLALLTLPVFGCGGESEEDATAPQDRCVEENLKAYLVGSIASEGEPYDLLVRSTDEVSGFIGFNEIRLNLGDFTPPGETISRPVILRIWDNDGRQNLIHRLADLTDDAPVTLELQDASQPRSGSQGRTSLSDFDCSLEAGRLCAQLGFDHTGDQSLQDGDSFAYNAASGELEIDIANSRVYVKFSMNTGVNVLGFQDSSSGSFQGCIAPRYSLSPLDQWPLALTVP